ncbi:MAG: ATP synthase F1 subunit gamma [Candidatus Levybacteria bacterium RIFCSPLOWO2_01_FULL_37_26]|nr:MAG: ATP synthase F1 subunit gamma [Candidatus Levybacteria bacterium RIFCSPHIGHO2_12_FULL_37_9]OGH37483.1 MAG: ATP synthase F1 subunit gamma [Candidatus Levybacteria bacterium RIFCSPLOWO2_01_FULL_37_26]
MANLLSLKRRIQTAQNVSKTTRAMQMIAASKLKKAQTAALSLRTYAQKLITLSQNLTTKIQKENLPAFMTERFDTKKTLIIILSPDKGLCGGLITNLVKEFLKISSSKEEFLYITVGKKAERQVINLTKNEILASFQFGSTNPTFDMVYPIVRIIDEYFIGKKVDAVKILYAQFENVFTQKPKITTLLPITISQTANPDNSISYLFEPDLNTLLPSLLAQYLQMSLYQYLLESFASEQGARMIAMQNATTNAKDVISELRLEYNKSRQEKITNEILDITNTGAIK